MSNLMMVAGPRVIESLHLPCGTALKPEARRLSAVGDGAVSAAALTQNSQSAHRLIQNVEGLVRVDSGCPGEGRTKLPRDLSVEW